MIDQILQKSQSQNAIPFRIDRFEGQFVVLVFESVNPEERQELKWPIQKLPEGTRIGEQIWLQLWTKSNREREREEILRRLLEELIA